MLGYVDIEAAAAHEPYFVDIVEGIRHKTVVAHQCLQKWREMSAAESNFWTEGKIGESGVVNSSAQTIFTAAPMRAGIECETEPAIEVIGQAEARAAWIRFQAAAHRGDSSWKQAVHGGAGMEEGVSTEKLPFGS